MTATISLSLIVRNEEDYLADCLESARPFVDEIVVVDTGSTDRTVEIARKYTDKVYFLRWEGDFGAARNFAKSHCCGEWIFSLDADEKLSSGGEALREIADSDKAVFFLPLEQEIMGHAAGFDRILTPRLLRNRPEYCYTGKVHEEIMIDNPAVVGCSEAPVITHRPVPPKRRNRNRHRNLILLNQAIAAEPDNVLLRYYLALEWLGFGRYRKALPLLRDVVGTLTDRHIMFRTSAIRSLITCLAAAGNTDEALCVCMEESLRYPSYADLFFDGGVLLEKAGEPVVAIRWFNAAVEAGQPPPFFRHTRGTEDYLSFYHLGRCHEKLARFEEAEAFYRQALAANAGYLYPLRNLLLLLLGRLPAQAAYEHLQSSDLLQRPDYNAVIAELFFQSGYPDIAASCLEGQQEIWPMAQYLLYSGRLEGALHLLDRSCEAEQPSPDLVAGKFVALLLNGNSVKAREEALKLWRRADRRGGILALLSLAEAYLGSGKSYLPERGQVENFTSLLLSIVENCLRYHSQTADGTVDRDYRRLAAAGLKILSGADGGRKIVADYLEAKAKSAAFRLSQRSFPAGRLFS